MPEILRTDQLGFSYPQHRNGLGHVSFALEHGQGLLVTGPSGSGKSTLTRCLTGLIPHLYNGFLNGQVWLDGSRTDQMPLWQVVEKAGLVFQNPAAQMLAPTVEDEIIFGLENNGLSANQVGERLEAALLQFGLSELRTRSPRTLSGGEQQKLALAAITARRPDLLVLDEPLSMLDPTAAADFVASLADVLQAGRGLVICEHRREYLDLLPGLSEMRLETNGNGKLLAIREGKEADPAVVKAQQVPDILSSFQLEIHGLHVQLGENAVLKHLDLGLQGGKIVAVVGRNGAGKTTLLRALAGLQAYEGVVGIGGDPQRPPKFGMVFQNPDLQLFNDSVRSEILYRIVQPDEAYYQWLLHMLKLAPYENTPPLLLSEGEKRRVALATTLMHRPTHGVLLDEPSLGQDMFHKTILMDLMRQLAQAGRLIILATHDLELAGQADEIILMEGGDLVAHGKAAEIFSAGAAWQTAGITIPSWVAAPC
jgi:energy-coupling factor transporter ATP-binding protein EcfA2